VSDCIFCKIVSGDIPSDKVYEDDLVIGFRDLNPQAPHHYLLIPKQHIATINDVDQTNEAIMGRLYTAAATLAKELGFDESGYRAVMNCNGDGGQTVYHVHLHVLAGRQLTWPPG
jgi:histidine triad (HIT) family protein